MDMDVKSTFVYLTVAQVGKEVAPWSYRESICGNSYLIEVIHVCKVTQMSLVHMLSHLGWFDLHVHVFCTDSFWT